MVTRFSGAKEIVTGDASSITQKIKYTLKEIHEAMLANSKKRLQESIVPCNDVDELTSITDNKKIAYAPFCNEKKCEESIKEKTGAKTLNTPFNQKTTELKCINCQKPATLFYFGKSY